MKLCKDCRWFSDTPSTEMHWAGAPLVFHRKTCGRPVKRPDDLARIDGSGSRELNRPAIYERRKRGWFFDRDKCGPDARYWHITV